MSTLHPTILRYFSERMRQHSAVNRHDIWTNKWCEQFAEVLRKDRKDVNVWLSDAYDFSEAAYHSRPKEISRGSYVLIARPEASYALAAYSLAVGDGIGLGKIGDLMGALWLEDVSGYKPRDVREEERRLLDSGNHDSE